MYSSTFKGSPYIITPVKCHLAVLPEKIKMQFPPQKGKLHKVTFLNLDCIPFQNTGGMSVSAHTLAGQKPYHNVMAAGLRPRNHPAIYKVEKSLVFI